MDLVEGSSGVTVTNPAGFGEQPVRPGAAYWDGQLGLFILKYDDVRASQASDRDVLDFCQSAYEAGANLAGWDRAALERPDDHREVLRSQ